MIAQAARSDRHSNDPFWLCILDTQLGIRKGMLRTPVCVSSDGTLNRNIMHNQEILPMVTVTMPSGWLMIREINEPLHE